MRYLQATNVALDLSAVSACFVHLDLPGAAAVGAPGPP
jgi:hypothetical protein